MKNKNIDQLILDVLLFTVPSEPDITKLTKSFRFNKHINRNPIILLLPICNAVCSGIFIIIAVLLTRNPHSIELYGASMSVILSIIGASLLALTTLLLIIKNRSQ